MARPRVALATCADVPGLDDDERLVIPALEALGITAEPAVWDDAAAAWSRFDAVVVRSTWDYSERRPAFLEWAAAQRLLVNAVDVLQWNTDKTYLRALESRGVPVVPTLWIAPGEEVALPAGEVVVKPAVSAGSRDTARYPLDRHDAAVAHVQRLQTGGRAVMVQPYVDSVDARGETGMVFIDGRFSHAVRKDALLSAAGRIIDGLFAPERITPVTPAADETALAERVMGALPWGAEELAYARVDIVRDASDEPLLLELELCEPSLFLAHGAGAAGRLASAIARRLV